MSGEPIFTPEMTVAVRVMGINRAEQWFSEERLDVLGIAPDTISRLRGLGIVKHRQLWPGGPMETAFIGVVSAIIDAVRA